jgi:hypothetical protein
MKAIQRFRFCYYVLNLPLSKCLQAFFFGKEVFKSKKNT